jgi:SAM-dependent methyltransferase
MGNIMEKQFSTFGVCDREFDNFKDARAYTYTSDWDSAHPLADGDDMWPPTPLVFSDNPTNDLILNAKNILDLGCGCGRNLPWVMENTDANYYGLDPNKSMLSHFRNPNELEWGSRVNVSSDISDFGDVKFDVVISTFVFMHIGYRPVPPQMNVGDVTEMVMKHTDIDTVWFLFEHTNEEKDWFDKWEAQFHHKLDKVFDRVNFPEEFDFMNRRNHLAGGYHLLRIYIES